MTNKPNDVRVSRELLRSALGAVEYLALRGDDIGTSNVPVADALRALLSRPADQQGEPVAHCVERRNGYGEWINDAKSWVDGAPCCEIVEYCAKYPELTRVRLAYAQPAKAKVDERAEFEAWHGARYPLHLMLLDFDEARGEYAYPSRREMFDVWQARAKLNGGQS